MEHWTAYTRFTTALPVILDPFIAVPLFLSPTRDQGPRQRMRIAFMTGAAVVLVAAAVSGDGLPAFMGTGLSSFRVGGGIVLLLMALAMLRAESGTPRTTYTGKKTAGGGRYRPFRRRYRCWRVPVPSVR